jgi:glycosyltransferase involved in cell wall biosynthesis
MEESISLTPLVSVCMPAYNADKYVRDAIFSVLNQTYTNLELIVINDGSVDDTAAVINSISHSKLKVIHQTNQGQCAAANAAFRHSKGDLIKFMDADDLISPNFIEEQVRILSGSKTDIVSAAWGRFYNDDLDTFRLSPQVVWKDMHPVNWLTESWMEADAMMQCAIWLIPREILNRSGLWDTELSLINDLEFFTRVLLCSEAVRFSPTSILYYRSGVANSLSSQLSDEAVMSAYSSIEKATSLLSNVSNCPETLKACANVWMQFLYDHYPKHITLTKSAEKRVKELGGSDLQYKANGITKALLTVLPWKFVKRLKRSVNQIGKL